MPSPTLPSLLRRWWPLGLAMGLAWWGGVALWWFCDDAFINYRFCGNAHDGHGFVWNPPPFLPVEGYTSFGWVAGLWLVWELLGVEPPQAAIPIAFAAGLVILWVVARQLQRLALPLRGERWRPWLTAVVLLGIAGNHSFATWLSSGMETSVYSLIALGWTLLAFGCRAPGAAQPMRPLFGLAGLAAAAHLVRPDGDLLVLATLAIAAWSWWLGRRAGAVLAGCLPLLVPLVHVLWRKGFYGEWQPNTYYAKVVAPWPESGLRYLYCFCVEQALWLWLPLAVAWLLRQGLRHGLAPLWRQRWPALVAVSVWLAHVGYYTLVVGGDHFAYRVFVHLVPLCALALPRLCLDLWAEVRWAVAVALLFALGAGVPGWWLERQFVGRELEGYVRTAPRLPELLRPWVRTYDRHQAWLLVHSVGFRRPLHAVSCALQLQNLPERKPGQVQGAVPGQRLVLRADAIGVLSWALADVAILDGHGLCDAVIARHRPATAAPTIELAQLEAALPAFDADRDGQLGAAELAGAAHLLVAVGPQVPAEVWAELLLALGDSDHDERLTASELLDAVRQLLPPRQMAHEREPPPGYIEALRPNVRSDGGVRRVDPEVVPLTDDELRAVEQRFRAQVGR
ncbi:MAG: hypothetical protein JNK49_18210 [Planctomycetes bacterium]|nr:hypothetical protein [Planctomycetota bacterium]